MEADHKERSARNTLATSTTLPTGNFPTAQFFDANNNHYPILARNGQAVLSGIKNELRIFENRNLDSEEPEDSEELFQKLKCKFDEGVKVVADVMKEENYYKSKLTDIRALVEKYSAPQPKARYSDALKNCVTRFQALLDGGDGEAFAPDKIQVKLEKPSANNGKDVKIKGAVIHDEQEADPTDYEEDELYENSDVIESSSSSSSEEDDDDDFGIENELDGENENLSIEINLETSPVKENDAEVKEVENQGKGTSSEEVFDDEKEEIYDDEVGTDDCDEEDALVEDEDALVEEGIEDEDDFDDQGTDDDDFDDQGADDDDFDNQGTDDDDFDDQGTDDDDFDDQGADDDDFDNQGTDDDDFDDQGTDDDDFDDQDTDDEEDFNEPGIEEEEDGDYIDSSENDDDDDSSSSSSSSDSDEED